MGINGGITCGSSQIFTLSVRDVFAVSLDVSLGEPKVKDKDFVGGFVETGAEVIWLNISMDKVPIVHIFNPGDHLVDQHQNSFQRKLAESLIEE